jgi:hypothetical protein
VAFRGRGLKVMGVGGVSWLLQVLTWGKSTFRGWGLGADVAGNWGNHEWTRMNTEGSGTCRVAGGEQKNGLRDFEILVTAAWREGVCFFVDWACRGKGVGLVELVPPCLNALGRGVVEEDWGVDFDWKIFCVDAGNFCKPREIKGAKPGRRGAWYSRVGVPMFGVRANWSRLIMLVS